MNVEFYRSVSAFFIQYLRIDSSWFDTNGVLKQDAMKECAELLIKNQVFDSKEDMILQALKDFYIMLPEWIFENVSKKRIYSDE